LATQADESKARTCNRQIGDIRQAVRDANVAIHQRIDNERSTSLRIMENQEKGLNELQGFVNQERTRHGQAKEDHESLKSQIRTLEERLSGSRFPPGSGHNNNKIYLTRQKGFDHLKSYNGEGGSDKWKEWRFGIMNWIEQEIPSLARLIQRVEKLETEPKEPENESMRVNLGFEGIGVSGLLNDEEQWASEQLWAILVARATHNAYNIIVGLDNATKSRGVRA
jgi:hypothetical protein